MPAVKPPRAASSGSTLDSRLISDQAGTSSSGTTPSPWRTAVTWIVRNMAAKNSTAGISAAIAMVA